MNADEEARDWLSRPRDWDLLPLRERRELAPAVAELTQTAGDAALLRRASSFLRQAGWGDDSVDAARAAYALDSGWESAVLLAGALRHENDVDEALKFYQVARRLRPDDLGPCLDMGDMLGFEHPRRAEALDSYAVVLDRLPDDAWALPSWLYLQAERGDPDAGERLLELAGDDPDNPQALRLALAWRLRRRLYWGSLPESTGEPGPPLLAPLLRIPYHAQFWGPAASRVALGLVEEDVAVLLRLIQSRSPLRVQLAAAMVLSRLDDEWEGSQRRELLLALLDAAHPSAIVASGLLAFEQGEPREELSDRLWTLLDEREDLHPVLKSVLVWLSPGFP